MNDDTTWLVVVCAAWLLVGSAALLEVKLSELDMMDSGITVEDILLGEELLAEGEEPPSEMATFRESRENRLEVVSQHPGLGGVSTSGRLVSQQ